MSEITTEKAKSMAMLTRIIGLIAALVIGLVAFIITYVNLVDVQTVKRIFLGLGAFVCGFTFATAIFYFVYALIKKDRFSGIVAYVALSIGVVVLLAMLIPWYFTLLVAVFLFLLFWLVSTAIYSQRLTLVADNKKPGYKTYEERKAEREAAEAEKEEEVLPEIKSFKD